MPRGSTCRRSARGRRSAARRRAQRVHDAEQQAVDHDEVGRPRGELARRRRRPSPGRRTSPASSSGGRRLRSSRTGARSRSAANSSPRSAKARRLRGVAEEPDPVAAGLELVGDADGGRHVAAAVPGDEQDVGHVSLSSPVAGHRRHQRVHALLGGGARVAAVAAQQLPRVDVGGDDQQVERASSRRRRRRAKVGPHPVAVHPSAGLGQPVDLLVGGLLRQHQHDGVAAELVVVDEDRDAPRRRRRRARRRSCATSADGVVDGRLDQRRPAAEVAQHGLDADAGLARRRRRGRSPRTAAWSPRSNSGLADPGPGVLRRPAARAVMV